MRASPVVAGSGLRSRCGHAIALPPTLPAFPWEVKPPQGGDRSARRLPVLRSRRRAGFMVKLLRVVLLLVAAVLLLEAGTPRRSVADVACAAGAGEVVLPGRRPRRPRRPR